MKTDIKWNMENTYAKLPRIFFTQMNPTPVSSPELVVLNKALAESLGLNPQGLESAEAVSILAGNDIIDQTIPIAQAYAGHQFGHFTMLGDGRAILLGEHITPQGDRFDIQLKGSGRTPYSRGCDGRAALGPMLREYIMSEAIYGLAIPTSRSLAVVKSGEEIMRETPLDGAILTRIASSHIRVGTFEYVSQWGTVDDLQILADYSIERHFPNIENNDDKYLSFLKEVIKAQASLIAKWQLVGFIHGVMNTDNMTISGETIDYGPCAFMDSYSLDTVFSSIDLKGRYAYGNQPYIAAWNLARFAESLLPLLHDNQNKAIDLAQSQVSNFFNHYNDEWLLGMKNKLGMLGEESTDEALIDDLLNLMEKYKADYTNTFRSLTLDKYPDIDLFNKEEFKEWHKRWQERLKNQDSHIALIELMKNNNPSIIPRNHRLEEALYAAVNNDDYSIMQSLLDALKNPYEYSKEQEEYTSPPEPSSKPYKTFCGT